MATKAGPKVAKQPYVDTLDMLSRQRYLEKLRIVDVVCRSVCVAKFSMVQE